MTEIVFVLVGLVAGAIVGYLWAHRQLEKIKVEAAQYAGSRQHPPED